MATPCPRCGATKTDPVIHGLMYKLVWVFGYRLQECARCRRPRFLPRHNGKFHDSSKLGKEPVSAPPFSDERGALRNVEKDHEPRVTKQVTAADSSQRELPRCPVCGSAQYHPTRRTTLGRILRRQNVAYCENCGLSFLYPGRREKYPYTQPKVTKQVTAADSLGRELPRCPTCGNPQCHLSRHTTLERILAIPRMAYCEKCGSHFPYPEHRHGSSDPVKPGEDVATVPRSAEEKRAPIMAQENNQRKVTIQVTGADSSNHGLHRCPTCGSTEYHRTKRTTLEHILLRPKMARCEGCGSRFLYPGRREKYPEPLEVVEPAETVPRPAEEKRVPEMAEESSQAEATPQVKAVNYSNRGLRRCPYCGSSKYHRTKRTTLDRILLRPAMAHCEKCETRFPYPKHHDRSPESVKSGEEAATVSPVEEQGRASRTAEESSQAKVDKQGTTADFSKGGSFRCPFCGSTAYRRSRRTTLERILLRPKMARCRNCRKRFPYPK